MRARRLETYIELIVRCTALTIAPTKGDFSGFNNAGVALFHNVLLLVVSTHVVLNGITARCSTFPLRRLRAASAVLITLALLCYTTSCAPS